MKRFFISLAAVLILLLAGCVSTKKEAEVHASRNLSDNGIMPAASLTAFFLENNSDADRDEIIYMAKTYINECKTEGINSDCAWVQMCLETGFLRFGNLVVPEMHNYCGLGAIDEENPGEWFDTVELGIRAHIQHLHAYATTEDKVLKNECIDRRYKYVKPRGKSPTIEGLAGTWAADRSYAVKLEELLVRLEQF